MGKNIIPKICSVDTCEDKYYAKEYCNRHWAQYNRNGKITVTLNERAPRPALEEQDYLLIPLGISAKDGYSKIDLQDKWVEKHKWGISHYGYACTKIHNRSVFLHRLILEPPKGMYVDHINHDTLDNRRENIRVCDGSESSINKLANKNSRTGLKGVYFNKNAGKYLAQVGYKGEHYYLGLYTTAEDAHKAYVDKVLELCPEFVPKELLQKQRMGYNSEY